MTKATYDIHLATDSPSSTLLELLLELGYREDCFKSGAPGIVHDHHFVRHPEDETSFLAEWQAILAVLRSQPFRGFAEAERVPGKLVSTIPLRDYDSRVPFPIAPIQQRACPLDRHKAFDVHIVAEYESLNPGLDSLLAEHIGFYVVDITKYGRKRRCYTIQPMGMSQAREAHRAVSEFLGRSGGMVGRVKTEIAHSVVRFPPDERIPPVVMEPLVFLPGSVD